MSTMKKKYICAGRLSLSPPSAAAGAFAIATAQKIMDEQKDRKIEELTSENKWLVAEYEAKKQVEEELGSTISSLRGDLEKNEERIAKLETERHNASLQLETDKKLLEPAAADANGGCNELCRGDLAAYPPIPRTTAGHHKGGEGRGSSPCKCRAFFRS